MEKKFWHKMVSDKVIPDLQKRGIICEYEHVSDEVAISELVNKIGEETTEFDNADSPLEKLREAADVVRVCRSITKKLTELPLYPMKDALVNKMNDTELKFIELVQPYNFTKEQLDDEVNVKNMLKGSFEQNFYLISTLENKKDSA